MVSARCMGFIINNPEQWRGIATEDGHFARKHDVCACTPESMSCGTETDAPRWKSAVAAALIVESENA